MSRGPSEIGGFVTETFERGSRTLVSSPIAKKMASSFTSGRPAPDSSPPPLDERDMTLAMIDKLTARATDALGTDRSAEVLPHPLVTEATLGHYLDRAAATQATLHARAGGTAKAVLTSAALHADLAQSLIHCLHQLDHRTRCQDKRLRELETELAEANRRVQLLESERR